MIHVKKYYYLIYVFFVVFLLISGRIYAADTMVGAKVWYPEWRPFLIDMGKEVGTEEGWQYIEGGSGVLYGPSISVTSDRITGSLSYLYGNLHSEYEAEFTAANRENRYVGSAVTRRHDIDGAVSYLLNDSFKVFLGFKYQPYTMIVKKSGAQWDLDGSGNKNGDGRFLHSKLKFKQRNYAPAAGAGYSYSINQHLAVGVNLSFLYFWGNTDINMYTIYYDVNDWVTPITMNNASFTLKVSGYGLNCEPAVLLVAGNDIFVQIGFRYQSVWIDGKSEGLSQDKKVKGMHDYLYGIFISCLYRI